MYNFLYEWVKNDIAKKIRRSLEELITSFETKYSQYLIEKQKQKEMKKNEKKSTFSLLSFPSFNFLKSETDEETLNDSFASCKSTKESKTACSNSKKVYCKSMNKRMNIVKKLYKKYSRGNAIDLDEVDEDQLPNPVLLEKLRLENEQLKSKSNSTKDINQYIKNLLMNIEQENNPFSFNKIETINKVILFPKPVLVEQVFAIYFKDRLFYNKSFVKMKLFYEYFLKQRYKFEIDEKLYFE